MTISTRLSSRKQPASRHKRGLALRTSRGVVIALAAALAVSSFGGSPGSPAAHAVDADLPTWADVAAAKKNEAAAAKKVKEIQALLVQLQGEVERTRAESDLAGQALQEAEQNLFSAQGRVQALETEAENSRAIADQASTQAGALVSQLYRSGGVDPSLELFFESDAGTADVLLERLAQLAKATERNTRVSEAAALSSNNAQDLADQAESARVVRDELKVEAERTKADADAAANAAFDTLVAQEAQQRQLEAQLAALTDKTVITVEGYEERLKQEEEEERKRREEAANNPGNGGGGPVTPPPANSSGWMIPLYSYWVSDWWGAGRNHTGVDLAAGGGTPIYAAASGTVTMSGWYWSYGNMVEITHGGGIATRYGHQDRTPIVQYGQWVNIGQVIGYVGMTGVATGNHLHFEVYQNGYPINPAPFYAARGLYF